MSLMDALSNAVAGTSAQAFALNTISGNIANSTTAGFKSTNTSFADMLAQTEAATQSAGGVAVDTRSTLGLQGTVASTGIATNLAIAGDGYFVVRRNLGTAATPSFDSGLAYTRRGDFAPDANGFLVNGAGYYLFAGPSAGTPVRMPVNGTNALSSLSVSPGGALAGTLADGSTQALGTVALAQFGARDTLASLDVGTFVATSSSGAPSFGLNGATVTGGAVEQSNATISDQFSKMIETQQAYTSNTKVISTVNEMLQSAIAMYV